MSCVELVYELPESVKKAGLSTVSLDIPTESAHTLWESTSKVARASSETQRITMEQRESFIQALNGHIQKHFHLKLEVSQIIITLHCSNSNCTEARFQWVGGT